jgi:hypothetical protein
VASVNPLSHQIDRARRLLSLLASPAIILLAASFDVPLRAGAATAPPPKFEDAQQTTTKAAGPFYSAPRPVTCESFAALVDNALVEWQEMQGTHFIIIARPGAGARAGNLSRIRLGEVESYLKQRVDGRENYVTAEGSRVSGPGRIQVYVGGSLRVSIPVRKNSRNVCSGKVNPFL